MFLAGCTMNTDSKKLQREVGSTFCGAQPRKSEEDEGLTTFAVIHPAIPAGTGAALISRQRYSSRHSNCTLLEQTPSCT